MIHLDLSKNKVNNLTLFITDDMAMNLKWLDISGNAFKEFPAIKCPKLEYLDVSYNKLEKVNEAWQGHPNLKVLKSVDNKFKTMAVFKNMPKLTELYLQNNAISALAGYEGLTALKKLNLRHNKIEKIEEEGVPELPELEYLNLRSNKLATIEDGFRLFTFPKLTDLNLINNPCELAFSSMNIMIGKFLFKKPALERFCKVTITDVHRLEAVYLANYMHTKEVEEQKRREAEEAAKAEAEEGG